MCGGVPFLKSYPIGPKPQVCWCCLPPHFLKWWGPGERQGESKGNPRDHRPGCLRLGLLWVPHTVLQGGRFISCFPWAEEILLWLEDQGQAGTALMLLAHAPPQNKGQLLCYADEGKQFGQNPLLLSRRLPLGVLGRGHRGLPTPRALTANFGYCFSS